MFLWGGWGQYKKLDRESWPSVEARFKVKGDEISYSYKVKDQLFQGKDFYNEDNIPLNEVVVYYNPENPLESTINNKHKVQFLVLVSLGIFMNIFFIVLLRKVRETKDWNEEDIT